MIGLVFPFDLCMHYNLARRSGDLYLFRVEAGQRHFEFVFAVVFSQFRGRPSHYFVFRADPVFQIVANLPASVFENFKCAFAHRFKLLLQVLEKRERPAGSLRDSFNCNMRHRCTSVFRIGSPGAIGSYWKVVIRYRYLAENGASAAPSHAKNNGQLASQLPSFAAWGKTRSSSFCAAMS